LREPFDALFRMTKFEYGTLVEMVTPDTNRGPCVAGGAIRLGGRKAAADSCRDEAAAAVRALAERTGLEAFSAREIYAEMEARWAT
jgi:hypothetical protein